MKNIMKPAQDKLRETPKWFMLRMTIARKIGLAVVLIVVLSIGAMAWMTSQNLNRGFLNYLEQLQLRELAQIRDAIAERYQREGDFEWLRGNRDEMRAIIDKIRGVSSGKAESDPRPPPPPPGRELEPPAADDSVLPQVKSNSNPLRSPLLTRLDNAHPSIRIRLPDTSAAHNETGRAKLISAGYRYNSTANDYAKPRTLDAGLLLAQAPRPNRPPPRRLDRAPEPRGDRPPPNERDARDSRDARDGNDGSEGPADGRHPPPFDGQRRMDDPDAGRGPQRGEDRPAYPPDRSIDGRPPLRDGEFPGQRPLPLSRQPLDVHPATTQPRPAILPSEPAPPEPSIEPSKEPLAAPSDAPAENQNLRARPPNGRRLPPPPVARQDPMGFGARLTIIDAQGRRVIGPIPPADANVLPIIVHGAPVGKVYLARLEQISSASDADSALNFVRGQIRDTLWVAVGLALFAIMMAMLLARHLLRPIAGLRKVTERLSRGDFSARAPMLGSDELAQLAQHVNQMAESLEQNEQQRRKVLADIAHELRTPLTVIRGEIEALIDGIRKLDGKAMDSLHVEVLRLNKMIDDVHQLTLADVGDLHFQFQQVDIKAVLEPVLERYQLRASKARLELVWDLPEKNVVLHADPGRFTQVITNLLENCVRYTDPGGRIVLAMQVKNEWLQILLDDSAPGVPNGTHARLFERLYRVDRARSRERGGSGLGLSICQALIHAHGGSIEAMPSKLGGVCMQIRLPLKKMITSR
nr:Signal transduction histidine-protein kinase BaeS [uncultured bacterium]